MFHGSGGGGPVTGDMISAARQLAYVSNADIMVSGHVHEAWQREYVRQELTDKGRIRKRTAHYIKCATYKDEYEIGEGGWHVERGGAPKPLGAWWLEFRPTTWDSEVGSARDVHMRAYRAD
jgi:hypothetical protein